MDLGIINNIKIKLSQRVFASDSILARFDKFLALSPKFHILSEHDFLFLVEIIHGLHPRSPVLISHHKMIHWLEHGADLIPLDLSVCIVFTSLASKLCLLIIPWLLQAALPFKLLVLVFLLRNRSVLFVHATDKRARQRGTLFRAFTMVSFSRLDLIGSPAFILTDYF